MENSLENQELDSKIENTASQEIPQELLDFKKICHSRCTICSSGLLKEIHDWRNERKHFDQIVELAAEKGVQVSASSLCRHFKTYSAFKTDLATQIIKNDCITEITSQAVHIRKTVELLDLVYEKVKTRLMSNNYSPDISDLEKLAKMRYQVLNGENPDDKDLMAIFQRASNDYGLDVQQGVLFKL